MGTKMKVNFCAILGLVLTSLSMAYAEEILMQKVSETDKSPSKEQVLWTATHLAYDVNVRQDFIGPAAANFGEGREDKIRTTFTSVRQVVTMRKYMAFLFHGGFEWNRYGFIGPDTLPVPGALHAFFLPLAIDFRFSQRDLVRLQAAPGYYSDVEPLEGGDFNTPYALGYAHVFSRRVQVGLGVSVNPWREKKILGGGGFRWKVSDRWTLKFLMPRPQVEYKVTDTFSLSAGSDFRGDTFRVGDHFGTDRNNSKLNGTLVDYQEVRAGAGFSWHILPLLELNGEAGMLVDREFNYHQQNVRSTSGKAPYVSMTLHCLFQVQKDKRTIPEQMHALETEFPWMRRTPAAH